MDAEWSPLPPSSSRSGDPPVRGRKVRCRYSSRTIGGIPARSARMTAEFENACRYHGRTNRGILRSLTLPLNDVQGGKCAAGCGGVGTWTRSLKVSVIQRAQATPPPRTRTQRSGSRPKRRSKGANVAFAARRKRSRADFATTQSPRWFLHGNDPQQWTRKVILSVIQMAKPVESPKEAHSSTSPVAA